MGTRPNMIFLRHSEADVMPYESYMWDAVGAVRLTYTDIGHGWQTAAEPIDPRTALDEVALAINKGKNLVAV